MTEGSKEQLQRTKDCILNAEAVLHRPMLEIDYITKQDLPLK